MPVIIDGTLGVNAAAITTTNWTPTNITTGGNTTLGDAAGDTVTINASTLSIPNKLSISTQIGVAGATATNDYALVASGAIATGGTGNSGYSFHNAASPLQTNQQWWLANNAATNNTFTLYKYNNGTFAGTPLTIDKSNNFVFDGVVKVDASSLSSGAGSLTNAKIVISSSSVNPGDLLLVRGANSQVAQPTSYSSGNDSARLSFYQGDSSVTYQRYLDVVSDGSGGSASSNIRFYTNSGSAAPAERVRIAYNGSVGIGTTSPSGTLHVAVTGGGAYFNTAGGIPRLYLGGGNGFGFNRIQGGEDVFFGEPGDTGSWRVRGSGTISLGVGDNATTMTIAGNGGNVGIGTAGITSIPSKLTLARIMDTNEWSALTIANAGSWSVYPNSISRINFTDGAGTVGTIGVGFNGQGFLTIGNFYTSNYGTSGEIMRVNGNGSVVFPKGQLQFPASQNASSDANTLDDYEEGSWPCAVNLLGTVSYSQQTGRYVKVGRWVTVSFFMTFTSTDSTQDNNVMYITGLPYAVSSNNQGTACIMTERMYGVQSTTAPNTFHVQPLVNGSSLTVKQNNYNGDITNASYYSSQARSGYKGGIQYILGTITYEAAS